MQAVCSPSVKEFHKFIYVLAYNDKIIVSFTNITYRKNKVNELNSIRFVWNSLWVWACIWTFRFIIGESLRVSCCARIHLFDYIYAIIIAFSFLKLTSTQFISTCYYSGLMFYNNPICLVPYNLAVFHLIEFVAIF